MREINVFRDRYRTLKANFFLVNVAKETYCTSRRSYHESQIGLKKTGPIRIKYNAAVVAHSDSDYVVLSDDESTADSTSNSSSDAGPSSSTAPSRKKGIK